MENNTEELKSNKTNDILVDLPPLNQEVKQKLSLAIYYESDLTLFYFNSIMDRFSKYFNNIFLISESLEKPEQLNNYENLSIVSSIDHDNFGSEWLMLLDTCEMPSLQLMENLQKVLDNMNPKTSVVKLPIVVCNPENGEIITVLSPTPRMFRQKPQLLNNENSELIITEYPLIKMSSTFENN
ncbi:MAG: hypothetical protein H7263_12780 [Candidatus Sericytochromatia bacterium]|nr:hypothetical protein [Candidatus Sericytochromatia bacterium]